MFSDIVPTKFDDFILNKDIIEKLKVYNSDNVPNLLLYGIEGAGKKTIINAFLNHLFDVTEIQTEIVEYNIKINNNDVTIRTLQSKYHYEINLYEYGLYDKHVLCDFVKELASTRNVLTNKHKIFIFNSFDKTNTYAQLALRRLMETLVNTARFILTTKSLGKLDKSLISRCYTLRVPYPKKDIDEYLYFCSEKLKKQLNKEKIIRKANNNLFKLNVLIFNIDYINPVTIFVKQIYDIIINSKNILFIDEIRIIIYKMHLLDFKPEDILMSYIKLCIQKKIFNNQQLYSVINEAALNELKCNI